MKNRRWAPVTATSENILCLALGANRYSAKVICERTGLSVHQVYYRLKLGEISIRRSRDGESVVVGLSVYEEALIKAAKAEVRDRLPK